jgi:lactoylglutathione lyase
MRTLHFGLRVADVDRSLAFYTAIGYEIIGSVPETPLGHLTMLKLPGDEFVTIELVHDAARGELSVSTGLSHFVIKVESLDATISELAARGIDTDEPVSPDDSDDFRTTWAIDPDGNRIELVQWPPDHADGITAADWVE